MIESDDVLGAVCDAWSYIERLDVAAVVLEGAAADALLAVATIADEDDARPL